MQSQILNQFRTWLEEDVRAISTVSSYINDVKKFSQYLFEKQVKLEIPITRFYFTSYMKHLETQGVKISPRKLEG